MASRCEGSPIGVAIRMPSPAPPLDMLNNSLIHDLLGLVSRYSYNRLAVSGSTAWVAFCPGFDSCCATSTAELRQKRQTRGQVLRLGDRQTAAKPDSKQQPRAHAIRPDRPNRRPRAGTITLLPTSWAGSEVVPRKAAPSPG